MDVGGAESGNQPAEDREQAFDVRGVVEREAGGSGGRPGGTVVGVPDAGAKEEEGSKSRSDDAGGLGMKREEHAKATGRVGRCG